MNRTDLPSHWKDRPYEEIEGEDNTINYVLKKLSEQAKDIVNRLPDVKKIETEIGITSAPGISLPLWVYFQDGNKEGIVNIVIKNNKNRFEYIWTE